MCAFGASRPLLVPDIDVFYFPPDDFVFEARARVLARQRPGSTLAEVEALLRTEYPNARMALRDRQSGAMPDEDRVTWYAYRDGRMPR